MEDSLQVAVVAKRLWSVVKLVLFMLRKGISKSKILMDLNMVMKRGKIAGSRAIQNLILATAGRHRDRRATSVGPCDEIGSANAAVKKVLESMLSAGEQLVVEASPALPWFGRRSPAVRQLRVTDSPFPLVKEAEEEDNHVDQAAEEFIRRFYSELRRQKIMASPGW